ncbi:hypothetical protein [Thalassospira sp. MIT1370]|uniref:hypothetical protein n=1 Tax=unclassified Thalassospira TaxID=2648997 RepID=UPI00399AF843
MTNYPYVSRQPFEKATRYDYASSEVDAFFESWMSARKIFQDRLSRVRADQQASSFVEPPSSSGFLSCVSVINGCDDFHANESFWALIRKFEVFGRLFEGYTAEMLRHPAARPADVGVYALFARKLFSLSENTGVLQFLSTGMKVIDALSGVETSKFDASTAREVQRLITDERVLVYALDGRIDG